MVNGFKQFLNAAPVLVVLSMGLHGCVALEEDTPSSSGLSSWPNPILRELSDFPPDLDPQQSLRGAWVHSLQRDNSVLAEATYPEYFFSLPWLDGRRSLFTLGTGTKIEVMEIGEDNKIYAVARATRGLHGEGEVVSRAFLCIDPQSWNLVFSSPLAKNAQARGMQLDTYNPEAYVLVEEYGQGEVLKLSTFDGAVLASTPVDQVPISAGRRSLALDSDRKYVYVLYGGQEHTSDFMPVTPDSLDAGFDGGVLILDARELEIVSKIQLGSGTTPVAVIYHQLEAKACALAHKGDKSLVFMIHGAFHNVTDIDEIPERLSDIVLNTSRMIGVAPRGVYDVDFFTGKAFRRFRLPFDATGEIAVNGDGTLAALRYSALTGPSGIALLDLRSNQIVEFWK